MRARELRALLVAGLWWRILVAGALVTWTGWLLGGQWLSVEDAVPIQLYHVDFKGAPWIRPAQPASKTFFRLSLGLTDPPQRATLWVDADQSFLAYVDGVAAGGNQGTSAIARVPLVSPIDLTRKLEAGPNVLALAISNNDGRPAAFRARLDVEIGGVSTTYTTAGTGWVATSDVTATRSRINPRSSFVEVGFDQARWAIPVQTHGVRTAVDTTVPPAAIEAGYSGMAVSGPNLDTDLLTSVPIDITSQPTSGWLRVAATGPYLVYLDSDLIINMPAVVLKPTNSPEMVIYQLSRIVHPGHHRLTFHVTNSATMAALYADGFLDTQEGPIHFATGRNWLAVDLRSPPRVAPVAALDPPQILWGPGLQQVVAPSSAVREPASYTNRTKVAGSLILLAAWLAASLGLRWAAGVELYRGLLIDAAGHLPGAAVLLAAPTVGRLFDPVQGTVGATVAAAIIVIAGKLVADISASGLRPGSLLSVRPAAKSLTGLRAVRRRVRSVTWYAAAVTTLGGMVAIPSAYRLDYEPLWQDEVASLLAARGMRSHILPQLPSGYLYLKGELYHASVAIVGAVSHDSVIALRGMSVFWLVATVLVFGLLLAPMVMPGQRVMQFATTLIFATAPAELVWSRDIRMYQMAQFFVVLFMVLFFRAMQRPTTSLIVASAASLVAMYLAHEESFVFLPAVPVAFLAVNRLTWLRDLRWWIAGGVVAAIIGGQYVLANATHPPLLGYDLSNKPYVFYDTGSLFYYINNVYFPSTSAGALTLVSTLAFVAIVVGLARRSLMRSYLTILLIIPIIALSTIFTPKIVRYTFLTLPSLFVLAGAGGLDVITFARWLFGGFVNLRGSDRQSVGRVVNAAALPAALLIATSLAGSVQDYGLAVSRLTGSSYSHRHVDLSQVANYVVQHRKPGDLLLTMGRSGIAAYYVGKQPDYILPTSRASLLYLWEKNDQVVDTTFGAPVILTDDELQHLLGAPSRIWLITTFQSLRSGPTGTAPIIQSNFTEVFEGSEAVLYLRGG